MRGGTGGSRNGHAPSRVAITGRGVRLARIPLRRDPRAGVGITASWDLDAGIAGGPAHHPDPARLPTGPCSILDVSRGPAAAAPLHSQGRSGARLDNRAPLASAGVARRDKTGRAGRPGPAGGMAGSRRDRQTPAAAGRIALTGSGQAKGQTRTRPKGRRHKIKDAAMCELSVVRPRRSTTGAKSVTKGGEPTCGSAAQHWQQSV